ncbi:ABC transporter substrate-binding protein [Rhodococcus sp. NPDC057135]|uniref:ABC transporter substrate-binding protein n=1 Tax=Rhodococcus sp. NPDC057135 TaxID=3346028 RepID=UPI0036331AE1
MKFRSATLVGTVAAGVLLLSACGAGGTRHGDPGAVVTDGALNITVPADPGNLSPHSTVATTTRQVIAFGYDSLVTMDDNGKPKPWLAETWDASATEVTFTLRNGITCADGSPLTAQTVADNYTWIADPAHGSPILGLFVPMGLTATADDGARTVTLTSPTPNPFLTEMTGQAFIACSPVLNNPNDFSGAFDGTGMYALTDVKPGASYTLTRRSDYTWGPDGTTSETAGLPKTVTINVVTDNTTRANLLLSGDTNSATVIGPDAERVEASGIASIPMTASSTQMYFNHDPSRITADPAVRLALVQGTNTQEIADILVGGQGSPTQSFQVGAPKICPLDDLYTSIPEFDADKAMKTLDTAGWTVGSDGTRTKDGKALTVKILYRSGTESAAAFEYLASQWKKIGVDVSLRAADTAVINGMLFSGEEGDWDIVDWAVGAPFPTLFVPFFSGTTVTNFARIDNPDYDNHVSAAMDKLGISGCSEWQDAERSIVANADVLPIGWADTSTYTDKFTARMSFQIEPWSIRQTD